ncbi:MAG: hypothetical protein RL581_1259, partial [Actinomycetota bacterium]
LHSHAHLGHDDCVLKAHRQLLTISVAAA